ncbi:hypothetical protein [Arenibacter certesii]|uniref:Uncharacterized protein n=1 Tax=Arenibacter certesii TaxID=228955 RepID=A0A918J2E7_9FLAO|nr:hypothetical protein [Arenibacter certesii]GGW43961.1 hypothetical protein GCM10007383_30630 [Arenibacter certesii]
MLMTPETKIKLIESAEKRLDLLTIELESLRGTYKTIEASEKFSQNQKLNVNFEGIKNLINYRIFIGILTADLCCVTIDYLNAKYQYQGLFSARQIVVITGEGYKKIYNFTLENKQGDLISKHRNNSFWIKEIGFITNELPEFKPRYDSLTQKLDNYLKVNFELLKEQRDLSIHYDKEPMKVITMLTTFDIEETFKNMAPFLQILNEMFSFTLDLSQGYLKKLDSSKIVFSEKLSKVEGIITKSK